MTRDFKIAIGVPSYNGQIEMRLANSLMQASKSVPHQIFFRASSLLAYTFNNLWTDALNMRNNDGYTHFLMVHADVVPELWFADKMLALMEDNDAGILSVVLPIKNGAGLTSTAMDTNPWGPSRFTTKQIAEGPPIFTHPRLLINTGLMMIDMRKKFANDLVFTINDEIHRNEKTGLYEAVCQPEDWNFSRLARKIGAKLYATRLVGALHVGPTEFSNQAVWGNEIDQVYGEAKL